MKTRIAFLMFLSISEWTSLILVGTLWCFIGCQNDQAQDNAIKSNETFSAATGTSALAVETSDSILESDSKQKIAQTKQQSQPSPDSQSEVSSAKVIPLFDGKSLEGWEVTQFGGQGETSVVDGAILLEPGFPLTGLHSLKTGLPTANYEILVEARKVDGIDFFCGLTFPVNESHCSFIVGGWAGTVVGLSMIDDRDASENETRKSMKFESGQWYSIRTRVLADRIQCWIDNELVVDQDTKGRKISLRNETLLSRPLGICSFETKAEIRKFELHDFGKHVISEPMK